MGSTGLAFTRHIPLCLKFQALSLWLPSFMRWQRGRDAGLGLSRAPARRWHRGVGREGLRRRNPRL